MDQTRIFQFIAEQKTAFLASVNEQGYPVVRAMLAPRKIDGKDIYFTTNASSNKVKQFLSNEKACVYFYKRGRFQYQGVSILGKIEVCTDQSTKDSIWRPGDTFYYKQGVTDPDYCVLKFTCMTAESYADLKTQRIDFSDGADGV